jgi:ATP synthase protein I
MTGSDDDLERRLRDAKERRRQETKPRRLSTNEKAAQQGMGLAFRVGAELVSALVVGVGLGLLLDRWLGTAPWGLLIMFLLGSAAGFLNVFRAVKGLGYGVGFKKPGAGSAKADPQSKDGDDRGRSA